MLRQQTVLAKFGELALKSSDLDEILTEACRLVGDALGTDLAKVMELHADGDLRVRAGVGWNPGVVGKVTVKASDNTSEGFALRTGEPMISADITTEARFQYPPFLTEHGVKAVANVVILGGRGRPAFGILQVDSREPRRFSSEDTNFLRSYANLIAAAVDRLRVLDEIRTAEERLRFAIQAGQLGVWEIDLRTGHLDATATCRDHFGLDQDGPVFLQDLWNTIHPDDSVRVTAALERSAADGVGFDAEYRTMRANSALRWVQTHAHVVCAADGTPVRLAGISLDVSTRRLTEERLRQSQRIEAVGRLTAGVAHDFNNVLQVLLSGIELAMDSVGLHSSVRADLELAMRAGQRGALLTSHLLSFSRQQALRPQAVSFASLARDLSYTLNRTLGQDVAIHIMIEPHLPDLFVDAAHLDSALLNLALNARDAMPHGGELRIEAFAAHGNVVIAVSDTGDGMTPDVLANACEPFFTTKAGKGSGLGLSMVQGFVSQSGGELRIHSTPGAGCRIEICMPVASLPAAQPPDAELPPLRGCGRILVVDDDKDVGQVAGAFLRRAGFEVTIVEDGNLVWAQLSAQPRFDALVADHAMPGVSGTDLVLQVRELHPGLPAIVITGYGGAAGLERLPSGVAVLHKPFRSKELVECINTLVEGASNVA